MAAQWDYYYPAAGDLGCLTSSRSSINTNKRKYSDATDDLNTQREAASYSVYGGSAGTQWRVSIIGVTNDIPEITQALQDGYDAIGTYWSAINGMTTAAENELEKLQRAGGVLYAAPPPMYDVPGTIDYNIKKAVALKDAAEAEIALIGLSQQRQAADDALVSALSRAIPAGWEAIRSSFAAVGITDVDDLTPTAIAAAMVDLSKAGGDTEGLLQLFQGWGNDPEVMDEYFSQLGGADTLSLIDSVGDEYAASANVSALELAQRIRSGLSLASSDWSKPEADAFAEDMMTGYMGQDAVDGSGSYTTYDDGRWAAMGYLFSDPANAPMGETLTLSTATEIDAYERLNENPGGTIATSPGGGGNALYLAEHPELVPPPNPPAYNDYTATPPVVSVSLDTAGRVFETLGEYPDSAFEFLSTTESLDVKGNDIGDLGEARIEYWFGERDWSGSDQFEGPAALWLGSQEVEHGPTAVGSDYWDFRGVDASEITSQILWEMQGNESFQFDEISDAAAKDFVDAISPHFDAFSDFIAGGQDRLDPTTYGATDYEMFGSGQERAAPKFTIEVLMAFLGDIAAQPAGAEALVTLAEQHADIYMSLSVDPSGNIVGDGSLLSEAMTRINVLDGLIDGSGAGATLAEAGRDHADADQAISDGVDAVTGGIGLIPIGNYAVGLGVSILTGFTGDTLESWLQDQNHIYDNVVSQMDDQQAAQQALARYDNGVRLYEALNLEAQGVEAPRPPEDGEDPQHYIDYTQDWYDNEFSANSDAQQYVGDALDLYKLAYLAGVAGAV